MLGNIKYLLANLSKSTLTVVLSTILLLPILPGLNKSASAAEMGLNNTIVNNTNNFSDSNRLLLAPLRISPKRLDLRESALRAHKSRPSSGAISTGQASWYGNEFNGRRTASGEIFNQYSITAAHKTLAFGTRVKVTNLNNGKSVVVRINDRGPYSSGRIIDLSKGAAQAVGMIATGVAPVKIQVIR